MKIKILPSARRDLIDGFWFTKTKPKESGDILLTLFIQISNLYLSLREYTRYISLVTIDFYQNDFLLQSITALKAKRFSYTRSWIAEGTLCGLEND